MRTVLLLLVATLGCYPLTASSRAARACQAPGGAPLDTLTAADWSMLVGTFQLVQVNSSDAPRRTTVRVTPLQLQLADSAVRAQARVRVIGNRVRNIDMIGTRDEMRYGYVDPAELDGLWLWLGCRACNDASPDALRLYTVTATGFTGRWGNAQTGIGKVVRPDGSLAPDPSGHFCARRVSNGRR